MNPKALGPISGIVAAGGNAGAVAFGFVWKYNPRPEDEAFPFMIVGLCVLVSSVTVGLLRFPEIGKRNPEASEDSVRSGKATSVEDSCHGSSQVFITDESYHGRNEIIGQSPPGAGKEVELKPVASRQAEGGVRGGSAFQLEVTEPVVPQ